MKTNMSVVEREILLTVVEEVLPKSNTELLVVEKQLNLVVSDSFSSSLHLNPPIYTTRIHILQKNWLRYHIMACGRAQTFWTEPGRVATAYSADKYKDKKKQHKSAEQGN